MELFYRVLGEGQPLLIIHGLYGSSDNWLTIANLFKHNYKVIVPDLRNHGQSPHDDEMSLAEMAGDIYKIAENLHLYKVILVGHSMGGKVAMWFTFLFPQLVDKLIIVDVAPKSYTEGYSKHFAFHKEVIGIIKSINPDQFKSRGEVEKVLMEKIHSGRTVRFLLKNLKKLKNNKFEWRFNINAIHRNLFKLIDGFDDIEVVFKFPVKIPALFIKGEKSDYLQNEDEVLINKYFSDYQFVTIPNCGHWVHAEQTELFMDAVNRFLMNE